MYQYMLHLWGILHEYTLELIYKDYPHDPWDFGPLFRGSITRKVHVWGLV